MKEIAVREGLLATFMGRPFADQGGSGFHVHLSLSDEDGHNAFADEGGPDGLSPLAAQFMAGVLAHAPGLQALLGPTVNAYKRHPAGQSRSDPRQLGARQPHRLLPRAAGARLPRSRVEFRTGDGSACAHLIVAGLLLAGLDGIERGSAPPGPVVGDAYRLDDAHAGSRLPADLGAALDALEADTGLVEPARAASSSDVPRDEAVRARAVRGGGGRARRGDGDASGSSEEYAAHL